MEWLTSWQMGLYNIVNCSDERKVNCSWCTNKRQIIITNIDLYVEASSIFIWLPSTSYFCFWAVRSFVEVSQALRNVWFLIYLLLQPPCNKGVCRLTIISIFNIVVITFVFELHGLFSIFLEGWVWTR